MTDNPQDLKDELQRLKLTIAELRINVPGVEEYMLKQFQALVKEGMVELERRASQPLPPPMR